MIVQGSRSQDQHPGLLSIVFFDCVRHLFFFVLLIAIIVVAFGIINQVQTTRNTVTELNKEFKTHDALEQEFMHLRLEQQTLAEHSRISDVAEQKIKMHQPDGDGEQKVIDLTGSVKR